MTNTIHCPKCDHIAESHSRFCARCGWNLGKPYRTLHFNLRNSLLLIGTTVVLAGGALALQTSKSGIRPTKIFQPEPAQAVNQGLDAELIKLRTEAQATPESIESKRTYANALLERIRDVDEPAQSLVLEATDVLSQILKAEPREKEALLSLGDISFNQKVFSKAVELYGRYLVEAPSDNSARSRYASALAFIGKSDAAIAELNTVLKADPKNFHALAYLSITYAQRGETKKALEIGTIALDQSPSAEARARFSDFLNSLQERGTDKAAPATTDQSAVAGTLENLIAFIKANPIAGPKFDRFESPSKEKLFLYFRDFPMDKMPPFAKEKFFAVIRQEINRLSLTDIQEISFLDSNTSAELDHLSVGSK